MRGKSNNRKFNSTWSETPKREETRDETAFAIWVVMLLIMFALAAIL
jgi:hypothetical protein